MEVDSDPPLLVFVLLRNRRLAAHNGRGRYHRILDLWTFRSMLESGVVSFGDFLTVLSADKEQDLLRSLVTAGNITDFFVDYDQWEASEDRVLACWFLLWVGVRVKV